MARKKGSKRRYFGRRRRGTARHMKSVPILPVAGAAIAVAQPVLYGINTGGSVSTIATNIANGFSYNFMAYDFVNRKFGTSGLVNAYVPIIGGIVAHKVLNLTGINRYLQRWHVTL